MKMSGPVKPDPIWLDTCVVGSVGNGDKVAEHFFRLLREEGHELLLVPAANQEHLFGNPLTMNGKKPVWEQQPSAASRAALQHLMGRLGIKVDWKAGAVPRTTRVGYAIQDHVKRPKNLAVPKSLDNISESDSLGSGLIDHSQNMTAAAMQIAEK
jgi:hypothetical protein